MEKEDGAAGAAAAGNDSVALNPPSVRVPRHPASLASQPQQTLFKETLQSRRDDDDVSVRSSVRARNAEELRRREEAIRRRDEDVELKRKMDAIDAEALALTLEMTRKKEAAELEALRIRHQREDVDAEEEDERRSAAPVGSDRVDDWLDKNASLDHVSPPLSPRYIRPPTASYHSSPAPSEASGAASVSGSKPTPKPRTSLSKIFPRRGNDEESAASCHDDGDFQPAVSRRNRRRATREPEATPETTPKMAPSATPTSEAFEDFSTSRQR